MSRDFLLLTSEPLMHPPVVACGRVSPSSRESSSGRHGFTLIELLIATVVLTVALVALTSAGAAIVKLESRGQRFSRIAAAGETRLELLRAAGCAAPAGQHRSASLDERWSATQALPRVALLSDSIRQAASPKAESSRVYVFRSALRC
jgi:prepilin-type N-terminal cleavage/methylation domain-containing protein